MCECFFIGFISVMLKGGNMFHYTNFVSCRKYEKWIK